MNQSMLPRLVSLVLKAIVIVSATTGVILSAVARGNAFMGGSSVFLYFTIQSNIALALVCLIGAGKIIGGGSISRLWYVVKYVATLSITLTGTVFCFVLAPTMGASAWNTVNVLTHVVVPVACILDFFVIADPAVYKNSDVIWVTIPPILYVFFAAFGYVQNWQFAPGANYPYFFLNWGSPAGAFGFTNQLPFMGCGWWILLLSALMIAAGKLYLVILGAVKKR